MTCNNSLTAHAAHNLPMKRDLGGGGGPGLSASTQARYNLNMHTARLLMREPFFAALSRRIDKIASTAIPTAGVRVNPDSAQFEMLYNPEFFAQLVRHIVRRCHRGTAGARCSPFGGQAFRQALLKDLGELFGRVRAEVRAGRPSSPVIVRRPPCAKATAMALVFCGSARAQS